MNGAFNPSTLYIIFYRMYKNATLQFCLKSELPLVVLYKGDYCIYPNLYMYFIIFCNKFIWNQLFVIILPLWTYFWTLNRLVKSILTYLVTGSDHAHF